MGWMVQMTAEIPAKDRAELALKVNRITHVVFDTTGISIIFTKIEEQT